MWTEMETIEYHLSDNEKDSFSVRHESCQSLSM